MSKNEEILRWKMMAKIFNNWYNKKYFCLKVFSRGKCTKVKIEGRKQMNNQTTEYSEELISKNMRLVPHILKTLGVSITDNNYEDLIQSGYIGLIKAARTFNNDKGKFSTYAGRCIRNEIFMCFREEKNIPNFIYFEEEIASDDSESRMTYETVIEDKNSRFIDNILDNKSLEKIISIILNCLTQREKSIILYGISGLSQIEIAVILKMSQGSISKIRNKAREKLKLLLEQDITYIEKYYVEVNEDLIRIIISTNDISKELENIVYDFSATYKEGKFIVDMSTDFKSFYIIAKIAEIIENEY